MLSPLSYEGLPQKSLSKLQSLPHQSKCTGKGGNQPQMLMVDALAFTLQQACGQELGKGHAYRTQI